jgi:magnesium chelatase family protein
MGPGEIRRYCPLDDRGRALLLWDTAQLQLAARGFHRVLRVVRTVGDRSGLDALAALHLAAALHYRPRCWS